MFSRNIKCKRILAITPTFLPRVGGAEIAVLEILRNLIKHNFAVDLITPNINNSPKFEQIDGINVYRTAPLDFLGKFRHLFNQYYIIKQIKELSKRNKYMCIHSFYVFGSGIAAIYAKKLLNTKLIITLLGQDIYDPINKVPRLIHPYLKLCMQKADIVTACSRNQKYYGEKISGRSDLVFIPHGININDFASNKKRSNTILTVKRLWPRGNVQDVIKIAKKVKKYKFIIIGDGPEKAKILKLINKYNLKDRVKLLSNLSKRELINKYNRSKLFLLTSLYEGFGIVYLEAMAAGLPIIAYNCGATDELVINGQNGWLFSIGAIEDIANKINSLKEQQIKAASKCALKFVKNYSWNKIIAQYIKQYKVLCNG